MMLKYDENDEETLNRNSKRISIFICLAISGLGLIIGFIILWMFPNILSDFKSDKSYLCKKDFWGKNCYPCLECGYNGICNGSGTKEGNGLCICNIGWTGKFCKKCDFNYFGKNCSKCTKCVNGYCNGTNTKKGNGKCICYNPYQGVNCDLCISNKYGDNCNKDCTCKNGICDDGKLGTGKCKKDSCKKGWTGENCDKCNDFYYQDHNKCLKIDNLTDICNHPSKGYSIIKNKYGLCQDCKRDNYGKICSGNGICDGIGTSRGDGTCNCFENYTGTLCQYKNYYQVNIQKCLNSCYNNGRCLSDLNNESMYCDCNYGFSGDYCQNCQIGYYGQNCSKCINNHKLENYWGKYCDKCECVNGNCNSGFNGTGECKCNMGWTGINCDTCLKDHYGENCNICKDCNNGICDDTKKGTGKCICKLGYQGETCQECSKGFIKINNYCQECPGSYAGKKEECSGNGKCTNLNNQPFCNCDENWQGENCHQEIKKTIRGNTKNCTKYNSCQNGKNGVCIDNSCFCFKGYTGLDCNQTIIKNCVNSTDCDNCHYCDLNKICRLKDDCLDSMLYSIQKSENIERIENKDNSSAAGISIMIVFIFLGTIGSCAFFVHKRRKIKQYFTNLTASKPMQIELTEEEKKDTFNPLLDKSNLKKEFTDALNVIQEAIDLDNQHYFKEAIDKYERGIDLFVHYMKQEQNAGVRFQIAKRIDSYVQRAKFLKGMEFQKKILEE